MVSTLSRSLLSFRLMRKRPLLSVALVPSTPMKEERLSTSGILQDGAGEFRLLVGHGGERNRGRATRHALDEARVLKREEAFGDHDVEQHRHHQRYGRNQHGERLVIEHPDQQPVIFRDHAVEIFLGLERRSCSGPVLPRGGAAAARRASAPTSAKRAPRSGW